MMQAQLAQGQSPLLAVRDVSVVFGGIVALNGVSFDMHQGAILGLIGPNGAGKTTLFNCLSRLYQPSSGDILMEGTSILSRPPHRIAEIGIGRTFQNLALFGPQSVLDNVRIGGHAHSRSDFVSDALHLPWVRRQEAVLTETAWSLLHLLELEGVASLPAAGFQDVRDSAGAERVPLERARDRDGQLLRAVVVE